MNVAVIDTGIDLGHPDLNAASGTNCVSPGAAAQDDNGHGTHVAGTIAAKNNGAGVVGVAPGTKVYAVKVLDRNGSGTWSQVICGIDWATGTRTDTDPTNDIAVANMSLGGGGSSSDNNACGSTTALHQAICNSTKAGVTYAVAAGNSGRDFDYAPAPDVPAVYPEVLTVTAMSDSDGLPGAVGAPPSCRTGEADDRYASFSNYAATTAGQNHTIAAPGVCIRSTWMSGGYNTISGTSMATPHVTGTVALCIAEGGAGGPCAGLSPAQIVQKLRSDAQSYAGAHPGYGFTGSPFAGSAYFGYLESVPASTYNVPPPPDTTPPAAPTGLTATAGDSSASLRWTANTEPDLSGYDVYRSTTVGGPYTKVNATRLTSPAYSDSGLTNGTRYYYVVKAIDTAGNVSGPSTVASAVPAPAPVVKSYSPSYTIVSGSVYSGRGDVSRLFSNDGSRLEISGASISGSYVSDIYAYASITPGERSALKKLTIDYDGNASGSGSILTLWVYNWTTGATGAWIRVADPVTGVTSDRSFTWSTSTSPQDYVSPTGEVRFSVRGTSLASFRTRTDLIRFTVTS